MDYTTPLSIKDKIRSHDLKYGNWLTLKDDLEDAAPTEDLSMSYSFDDDEPANMSAPLVTSTPIKSLNKTLPSKFDSFIEEPGSHNTTFPKPSKDFKGLYKAMPYHKSESEQAENSLNESYKAHDWFYDNVAHGPLPSEMVSRLEFETNIDLNDSRKAITSTPVKQPPQRSMSQLKRHSDFLAEVNACESDRLDHAICGEPSLSVDEEEEVVEESDENSSEEEEDQAFDKQVENENVDANNEQNNIAPEDTTVEYELRANDLLNQTLPPQGQARDPAMGKLNKSFGDKPNIATPKRKLVFGKGKFVPIEKKASIKLVDSGNGVAIHTKPCDCSLEDKAKRKCLCLKKGKTLTIVRESENPAPPCCKSSKEKEAFLAASNAKKALSLSKIIKQKNQQFQIMMTENLKLARKNGVLKVDLQASNVHYHRQRNANNEAEMRNLALKQKCGAAEHRIVEIEGSHQEAEKLANTIESNFDQAQATTNNQKAQILELNTQIGEMEESIKELTNILKDMNEAMKQEVVERVQRDNAFEAVATDNSILKEQCDEYLDDVIELNDAVEDLETHAEDLAEHNESLAVENKDLEEQIDTDEEEGEDEEEDEEQGEDEQVVYFMEEDEEEELEDNEEEEEEEEPEEETEEEPEEEEEADELVEYIEPEEVEEYIEPEDVVEYIEPEELVEDEWEEMLPEDLEDFLGEPVDLLNTSGELRRKKKKSLKEEAAAQAHTATGFSKLFSKVADEYETYNAAEKMYNQAYDDMQQGVDDLGDDCELLGSDSD